MLFHQNIDAKEKKQNKNDRTLWRHNNSKCGRKRIAAHTIKAIHANGKGKASIIPQIKCRYNFEGIERT